MSVTVVQDAAPRARAWIATAFPRRGIWRPTTRPSMRIDWPLRRWRGLMTSRSPALTLSLSGFPHARATPRADTRMGRIAVDTAGRTLRWNRPLRPILARRGRPWSDGLSTTPTRAPRSDFETPKRARRSARTGRIAAPWSGGAAAHGRDVLPGTSRRAPRRRVGRVVDHDRDRPTTAAFTPVASKARTWMVWRPSERRVVSIGTSTVASSLQGTGSTNGALHAPWFSSTGSSLIGSPSTSTRTRYSPPPTSWSLSSRCRSPRCGLDFASSEPELLTTFGGVVSSSCTAMRRRLKDDPLSWQAPEFRLSSHASEHSARTALGRGISQAGTRNRRRMSSGCWTPSGPCACPPRQRSPPRSSSSSTEVGRPGPERCAPLHTAGSRRWSCPVER